jgi:hypothetical protein
MLHIPPSPTNSPLPSYVYALDTGTSWTVSHNPLQIPTHHVTAPAYCTYLKLLNTSSYHAQNTGLLRKPYAGT